MATYGEYITIAELKAEKGITKSTRDPVLLEKIRDASRMIDAISNRFFYPLKETRLFNVPPDECDNRLQLDRPLLEVLTLLNGDGTTMTTSHYLLYPSNVYPKHSVGIKKTSSVLWQTDSNADTEQVISLSAIWGYHSDYANAWQDSAGTVQNTTEISASATSLAVQSGKLKDGQLIKIESEYCYVAALAMSGSNDAATIVRGVHGTTAAIHPNGAAIYIWQPERVIAELCKEVALGLYLMRNNPVGETMVLEGSSFSTPKDIEKHIEKRLRALGFGVRT